MAFRGENKLGGLGKKSLLEICSDLVLFELFVVADATALVELGMGAKAKNMVISVVFPSVRCSAQREFNEVGPGGCRGGFLGEVVTNCPKKFMKEFFIVSPKPCGSDCNSRSFGAKLMVATFQIGRSRVRWA